MLIIFQSSAIAYPKGYAHRLVVDKYSVIRKDSTTSGAEGLCEHGLLYPLERFGSRFDSLFYNFSRFLAPWEHPGRHGSSKKVALDPKSYFQRFRSGLVTRVRKVSGQCKLKLQMFFETVFRSFLGPVPAPTF